MSDITDQLAAGTPPKVTAVGPERNVPLIVTGMPVPAIIGVKLEIVGAGAI